MDDTTFVIQITVPDEPATKGWVRDNIARQVQKKVVAVDNRLNELDNKIERTKTSILNDVLTSIGFRSRIEQENARALEQFSKQVNNQLQKELTPWLHSADFQTIQQQFESKMEHEYQAKWTQKMKELDNRASKAEALSLVSLVVAGASLYLYCQK
mmetsp:Transcript_21872/g.30579  ORF Transcript_21872/g.30579 Transcript_21872/m.30579 type:complete len:156 (+) Transcript_21872:144-611(+)|eukprot:CAMPEP_0168556348 /NCGR_PEP_ID=MMETSP0413-20121227/8829_1 /TAXON_ID=136452 /ORGANISM="Filamoeba nolandi, Strain NC-AS-23-1" /LENGTH=155 /DNA_ID=CAMNT_0008587277 /DNA_START=131 /DNA_END=598 /DNA_ORIENTATION=+